jgi:hypothetical protein
MRVRLKGLNRAKVKLANGERITYYYARRGGPRLVGEPGSPEFIASYYAAIPNQIVQHFIRSLPVTKRAKIFLD